MYIYRVSSPYLDEAQVYNRGDLDVVIPENEIKQPMYSDLLPYCQKLRVRSEHYDMDKILADYGLSLESYISMLFASGIHVTDPKAKKTVSISDSDINHKYTKVKIEDSYVCCLEEVCYWRKAYNIQGWFYDQIGKPVENTGYYVLTEDVVAAYNKLLPDEPLYDKGDGTALVYWEWY